MKVNTLSLRQCYRTVLVAAFAATFASALQAESQLSIEQRLSILEQQSKTRNQLQTNMSIQLIELQKEVKELRGIIEEHDYKLQQIQERQRDLYRDIENRLSSVPQNTASQSNNSQSVNTANKPSNQASNVNVVSTQQAQVSSGDARAEFEEAFKLVRNKQYVEAIAGFEAFLKNYPTSDYSDNARFWIGQVYYAQSNLTQAEKQFSMLRTEFPASSKVSSAMLKLAEIKMKQQKWQDAKALYNEILSKYTGAPQQLARKGLQDIKQAGH